MEFIALSDKVLPMPSICLAFFKKNQSALLFC